MLCLQHAVAELVDARAAPCVLHATQGICVQGPFQYRAMDPTDIHFVPLKQTRQFRADQLLDHYLKNDQKLKRYVPLIRDSKVYPVICDANGVVLSLPPVINGAHSAITLDTKNVFIECTATDLTKAKIVLNTVVSMFSECALSAWLPLLPHNLLGALARACT